jgi:hypothetical protein
VCESFFPQEKQARDPTLCTPTSLVLGMCYIQDERVCVLKLELVETTSLLKNEEMTPRLGGRTDVLLIDGYDE